MGCAHEGGVASSDTHLLNPAQFAQGFLSKHQNNASNVFVNNLMLSHSDKELTQGIQDNAGPVECIEIFEEMRTPQI